MSIDRSVAVGVEMASNGATVALVSRYGQILHRCQVKTLRGRPIHATLEPYFDAIDATISHAHAQKRHVCGLGVSIPGSLDASSQKPLSVPTMPILNGIPLLDILQARYRLPTHLHVDVDAAGSGEYRFGAGQGTQRLLFLTMNAVVGAAFVKNGDVVQTNSQQSMGHICHLPVSTQGPRCSCGKHGCINTLISLDAMQRTVQRAVRRGEESTLTRRMLNREYFSPQMLAEEAQRGDSVALKVYSELGRWLSSAIVKYVALLELDTLVLGGRVAQSNALLLTQVQNTLPLVASTSNVMTTVRMLPGLLGNDAMLIGAVVPLL